MSDQCCNNSKPSYGFFTLIGDNPVLVGPGENIRFNQHGSIKNVKFCKRNGTIKILESGDYKIEYILLLDGPAATSVYGIFLNNNLVDGFLTNFGITRQVNNATLMLVGQAIIPISKNTCLQLRNIGTNTDTLLTIQSDRHVNAASLSIIRLS